MNIKGVQRGTRLLRNERLVPAPGEGLNQCLGHWIMVTEISEAEIEGFVLFGIEDFKKCKVWDVVRDMKQPWPPNVRFRREFLDTKFFDKVDYPASRDKRHRAA